MLEGDISEIDLTGRLVELWREQFTGAIRFENDGIIKIIYFKGGDILSASTNDRADSIDEILMKAGKISREHVKQALAKRKETETLGDALLNLGFITRKELTWARRVQVVGVIRSVAAWESGSFTIVADYLPKRDEGTLFPFAQVLVELIVTDQDRARFERALDGGSAVYAKSAEFDEVFRRIGLNEEAETIVAQVDGESTANEIAVAAGTDAFNVYKLLHALAALGILTRAEKVKEEPQFSLDDFASAGVADAADVWAQPTTAPADDARDLAIPRFELDEEEALRQPTLEVSLPPIDEPTPAARNDAAAQDEPRGTARPEPPTEEEMPAWEAPPREPVAIPIPASITPAAAPEEEQWGFDEAQIETARRSVAEKELAAPLRATPVPRKAPKRRVGAVLAILLAIAIVGGAGYFAWLWWQGREELSSAELVQRPVERPAIRPPAATATTATVAETTTGPLGTATAPVPLPDTAGATATAAQETAPLPRVVARSGGDDARSRVDALARQYAANPAGNYTVQIQILCDPANVENAIRTGGGNVWFVPQALGGRACYRVFWGRYDTAADAGRGLAQVPQSLRDGSAAVKRVPGR